MEISLSITIWKYALLALSVFISILDVCLVSYGVEALGCARSVAGAYSVTAIGMLVLTLCFIASFASLRESSVISIVFIVSTSVCVVLQTIFMIYFASQKSDFMELAGARVDTLWENGEPTDVAAIDLLQAHYYCCGRDSAQDFLENSNDVLPTSCCINADCSDTEKIYTKGCHDVVVNFFDNQSDNMIITLVGVILLEALGIASAYYLCKSIQKAAQKGEQNAEIG